MQVTDSLREAISKLTFDVPTRSTIDRFLAPSDRPPMLWDVANLVGSYMNGAGVSEDEKLRCIDLITMIREFKGDAARRSTAPATVVFGTSGWRDVIGEGFTVLNVHKVVRGIIEMMQTPAFLHQNGYVSFSEVQSAGVLIFRDNRYMGDEFLAAAEAELVAAGVGFYNAGECPTGVGSAVLRELGGAGSINFTPSHNPMEYAGIKFNPRDGGPADPAITTMIEEKANAYMTPSARFEIAPAGHAKGKRIDAKEIFTTFVEGKSKVFDLHAIRAWLHDHRNELLIIVDNMHGASRGYIEHLLGDGTMKSLRSAEAIRFVHTNDDYSFHGLKPEPSAGNQKPLIDALAASRRKFTLAVALDPDADRIRCADARLDCDMNRFGAIAYANLLAKGMRGGVASTVPSSDFALEIAKRNSLEVFETAVGFKNFRQPLGDGRAILAFEESDGISFYGHTLEKCAIGGFLAALDCLVTNGSNLSDQYDALRARYGYFYPDKAGAEVKGISVEEWQRYRRGVEEKLRAMHLPGDSIDIGGESKKVAQVNTTDGTKAVFDDKSWILVRSSGTEPKFRYYYEVASELPISDIDARLAAYRDAGAAMLARARAAVV